jgi:hypothetical protein
MKISFALGCAMIAAAIVYSARSSNRYDMTTVAGGMVRIDRLTGEAAFCTRDNDRTGTKLACVGE